MGGDGSFNCFTDRFGRCQHSITHFNWVKGENPTFLNPLKIFTGVKECGHASVTKAAITSVVTTRPGLLSK